MQVFVHPEDQSGMEIRKKSWVFQVGVHLGKGKASTGTEIHVVKRLNSARLAIREYWVTDRFRRTMIVVNGFQRRERQVQYVRESQNDESPRASRFRGSTGPFVETGRPWAKKRQ